MPSVLEILFFLGIALLIITLVGHGIWVFLAFIFGGRQKKHKRRILRVLRKIHIQSMMTSANGACVT